MGWRIRHGVDLGTTTLLLIGGLVGALLAFVWDHLAHQYRGTL